MFKKQPSESERIRSLFEQNTIRKSGEKQEPLPLSLPDPIEGAPALKPYRRPPEANGRSVLLPFKQPEPRQEPRPEVRLELPLEQPVEQRVEPPASSHSIARLNRLYEISADKPETRESKGESKEARPEKPEKIQESPELQNRLRKTQLRLKAVQMLLRVSTPLGERLKEISGLMCESFSLWQVQIHLPVAHRPEQLEVLGSYTRSGSKAPRPNSDSARQLQKVFKDGREASFKQADSQHLLLPLSHRSERLGVLEAVFSPAHSLSADEQLTLKSLAEEIAFYLAEEQKQDADRSLSDQDTLTGLLNHRAFQQSIESCLKASAQLPVSLILLDLDFFRQINEVHGYLQGDQVLQQIARLLARKLGDKVPLARFGGEEFALLLPQTSLERAWELAGELRQAIACEKINGKFNSSLGVTASLGVASLREIGSKPRQTLLEQAFGALAMAKEKGRNQVQVYEKPSARPQPEPTVNKTQAPVAVSMLKLPQQQAEKQLEKARPAEVTSARKWSEILLDKREQLGQEWQRQTDDYAVPEVGVAMQHLAARLPRLLESLCGLLDHKQKLEELEQMPLSYFMPSQIVAEIRRGQHQLISYEVAFMLLQESLLAVLGTHGSQLQDAVDHFFLCINEKLTAFKSELQKGS
ncbi:MAG TPA: GGDEF domain-containing protein [Candidatus Obscuribacterales bacterium]